MSEREAKLNPFRVPVVYLYTGFYAFHAFQIVRFRPFAPLLERAVCSNPLFRTNNLLQTRDLLDHCRQAIPSSVACRKRRNEKDLPVWSALSVPGLYRSELWRFRAEHD